MSEKGAFGGSLTADFPSHLVVDVTEYCNLACTHCPYVSLVKPKGKARHQYPPDLHAKLVAELESGGREFCSFVRYTGEGETLLHPQIMDFLAEMQRIGVRTTLTTNGLLLDETRCAAILAAGTAVVDISLDAFRDETYAAIRVGGELPTAREGVRRLIRMKREQNAATRIVVSFIRQEKNNGEAELFQEYWRGEGADDVFLRNLHSCAGLMEETARTLWAKAPKPRTPCLYPWERLNLKSDGLVDFCPSDWKHGSNVGDFRHMSLREIWQSEAMQAVRAAHRSGDFSAHPFCGQCPDWSTTVWPGEGKTYATVVGCRK